jgi:hypothetical protein
VGAYPSQIDENQAIGAIMGEMRRLLKVAW